MAEISPAPGRFFNIGPDEETILPVDVIDAVSDLSRAVFPLHSTRIKPVANLFRRLFVHLLIHELTTNAALREYVRQAAYPERSSKNAPR